MTDSPQKRPSRLWYLVAIILIVLGPIASLILFFNALWGNSDKLIEVSAKGNSTVTIQEPGTYLLAQSTPQQSQPVNVMNIVVKDLENNTQQTFAIKQFKNIAEKSKIGC